MLFSAGFWSDQMTFAVKAWAIVVPLLLLAFGAGFKTKVTKATEASLSIKAHAEALEARLELARELNEGETKAIAAIRDDIVELKKLIGSDKQFSQLESLLADVDERTDALAVANRTTDHLLNAKKLAIGD